MQRSVTWALVFAGLSCVTCSDGTSSINDFCPTIDGVGGDPTGEWKIDQACQVPYPRTGTTDWCSKLVYDDRGIKDGLVLGQEFLPIIYDPTDPAKQSKITYVRETACGQDCGSYTAKLIFEGPTTTHFPAGCLNEHKFAPTCVDLTAKIQALVDANVLPTIQNVACSDDGDGGCACSYLVTTSTITDDTGLWRIIDGLLVHYPSTLAQPSVSDYAVVGNHMELHGHDGTPLLARSSIRNLSLSRP